MKTFTSISDLLSAIANLTPYIQLSNGFYCPTTKKGLKAVANTMKKAELKFEGTIIVANWYAQIKIN